MTIELFLALLSGFSVLTSLIVEAIKNIVGEKKLPYNIVALCVGMIVGILGCMLQFYFGKIAVGMTQTIYALLMGFASALCATVGYDKVKQTIEQLLK